ncbi:MAG TPA: CapA family protein [Solirubrobacteraceae bacterium]|nr:CapA family protein [Solirubrobacteraceae bacterium]
MSPRAIPAAVAAVLFALAIGADPATAARRVSGVSIVWGGDVTLGSSYGRPPNRGRPQLASLTGALRRADVAAVNYEGTFGSGGRSKCAGGRSNCFAFQAPPANAATLRWAGIDVVNQANNHAHDFGGSGMAQTHAALRGAGVRWTGAPGQVTVLRRGGARIAFVGFSTYPWSAPMSSDAAVRALVGAAARRARIVVAFLHAGAEGAGKDHVPYGHEHAYGEDRGDSRRFARVAVDAGADLVLGSGPHVVRGLQLYRDRLIAYSLGNLTGWHNFGTGGNSALSALLRVDVDRDGALARGSLISLRLDGAGVPHADPARGAERLMRSLSASDFGDTSAWSSFVAELR